MVLNCRTALKILYPEQTFASEHEVAGSEEAEVIGTPPNPTLAHNLMIFNMLI